MQTISYTDKSALNENAGIADINKCNASDMNEIKSVVNSNASECGNASNLNTTDKTSIVNAINEVNSGLRGLIPVVVYNNSTGVNGNVALSQSINSAKEVHITYRQEGYSESTKTDIVLPGETKHQLSFIQASMSNNILTGYLFSAYIALSGSTITYTDGIRAAINNDTTYLSGEKSIYITKVVAYY